MTKVPGSIELCDYTAEGSTLHTGVPRAIVISTACFTIKIQCASIMCRSVTMEATRETRTRLKEGNVAGCYRSGVV